jgi:gamma-glutamyltranspeptidase/glutathione hydrolase
MTRLFLAAAAFGLVISTASPAAAAESAVVAKSFMVSAANPHAAEAGYAVLKEGGSAIDAMIATQMVLNLVEPQSSGIGGGAFLLHWSAASRALASYDGRETAPAAATPALFLKADGSRMGFWDAVVGGRSVGMPGILRMLELAHDRHGKLPWRRLFESAIQLADEGFAVSPRLHKLVSQDKHLQRYSTARTYFYDAEGAAWPVGHRLVNKPFAATLRAIADGGADVFYTGAIAADIVTTVTGASGNPGLMTSADLEGYEAKVRPAVCGGYRGYSVCGMGPPSSGGLTVAMILGLIERFDVAALGPNASQAIHHFAEAGRLAYADRNLYMADSDFVDVPSGALLGRSYLKARSALINANRSMGKASPGNPDQRQSLNASSAGSLEGYSTTHISIVDADGNAASMTSSIESAFGSRLMVRGFLLNNQLTDFSFLPEKDGKPVANRADAGKRPRSSMSPTIVLDGQGDLKMVIGSPGGSRIINYVAKTILAALDWGQDIQEAISFPHFINRNGRTELEKGTSLEASVVALEALGHEVATRVLTSGLHGIMITSQGLEGGADPRREGVVLGD